MPSVSNPNGPSRNRIANHIVKARAIRRRKSDHARHKISKADTTRGARPGLLPTSGPRAPISKKKAKKLEQAMKLAERRRVEAEEETRAEEAKDGVEGEEDEEDDMADGVETSEVVMEDIT